MIGSLPISIKQWKLNRWAIMALLFYAGILYYALRSHIIWQSVNVLLGLIALPVVTVIRTGDKGAARYAVWAILLALCCIGLPVKTIFYFAIACSLLFVIETALERPTCCHCWWWA